MKNLKLFLALAIFIVILSPSVVFGKIIDYGIIGLDGLTYASSDTKNIELRWNAKITDLGYDYMGTVTKEVIVLRSTADSNNFFPIGKESIPNDARTGEITMTYTDTITTPGSYQYRVVSVGMKYQTDTITINTGNQSGQNPGGNQSGQNSGGSSSGQNNGLHPSIFNDNQWRVLMFWYTALTTIGGAFLLFAVLRSGYGYMAGALNPGVRASFIEDVQRMLVAMVIIAAAPAFVFILNLINDQLVKLFALILKSFVQSASMEPPTLGSTLVGMFERIVAAPFTAIINIFNWICGTKSIDDLVFNGQTGSLFHGLFSGLDTGNPIADVVLNGALTVFTVYFNAIYAIRKWLLAINLVATPIIAWVWAISAEKQIIEIWVASVIQTIFMQAAQALAFGVCASILLYTGGTLAANSTNDMINQLIALGLFAGGFVGSIGMFVIIFNGFKLILNSGGDDGKKRSEALQGIGKAVIGMIIVGLAMSIAGFLAWLLSGSWGINM